MSICLDIQTSICGEYGIPEFINKSHKDCSKKEYSPTIVDRVSKDSEILGSLGKSDSTPSEAWNPEAEKEEDYKITKFDQNKAKYSEKFIDKKYHKSIHGKDLKLRKPFSISQQEHNLNEQYISSESPIYDCFSPAHHAKAEKEKSRYQTADFRQLESDAINVEARKRHKMNSMSASTAKNVLRLVTFLNKALGVENSESDNRPRISVFYYGPSIYGMTTQNQVQFSLDFKASDGRNQNLQ